MASEQDLYDTLISHFPDLSDIQLERFKKLLVLYPEWNSKINVISRKDIDLVFERHILHALAIAKVIKFKPGTRILDAGTGGGFPGIPLAIFFPECRFLLADSIGKKIHVVNEISAACQLQNVSTFNGRVENITEKFDFVVSRAVTALPEFCHWVEKKISVKSFNDLPNGILYLKGGDITEEIKPFGNQLKVYELKNYFADEFFETKKLIHLRVPFKMVKTQTDIHKK